MVMYSPRRGPDGIVRITDKQQKAIDWLLTAPSERQPESLHKLAKELGVSYETLRLWRKKDPFFIEEWRNQATARNISPEAVQPIIEMLRLKAEKGDLKATELYLKYIAQIMPPQKIEVTHKDAKDLSDEEVRKAAQQFLGLEVIDGEAV